MAASSQGGRPCGTQFWNYRRRGRESGRDRLGDALCRDDRRQCRGAGPRRHFGGRRRCLLPQSAAALGIAVHITLTVALGVTLSYTWRAVRLHKMAATGPYPFMLAALAGVWATTFFVILPIISPAFIHLVPYAVSLTSKLLVGLAAAAVLQWPTNSKSAPAMNLASLRCDKRR